jgi:ankyrin repeat protein
VSRGAEQRFYWVSTYWNRQGIKESEMTLRTCAVTTAVLMLCAASGRSASQASALRFYDLIRSNDLKGLKAQVEEAGVDLRDDRGATPLMQAVAIGSLEAVRLLLDAGADVNARNASGATALLWAAGHREKSRLLIQHGADVHVRSKLGKTPVFAIVGRPANADLLRTLIDRGVDLNAVDAGGNTPLMSAVQTGDLDMVRLLVNKGANVNASSAFGFTALIDAVTANWGDAARLLLARGANPNAANDHHGTVRHGPVAIGHVSVLMAAAPYGPPSLIAELLKAGADVNARDVRGMTPVMLASASENQDPAVVQTLLDAGADPAAKSAAGATALDWATRFGGPGVIAALKRANAPAGPRPSSPADILPRASHDAAAAVTRSLPLLQRSSTKYFQESFCVGCHHQMATAMAVGAARSAGIPVDEAAARDELKQMTNEFHSQQESFLEGGDREVLARRLFGLTEAGYPPDAATDAAVVAVMSKQTADGSWTRGVPISRAPMQEGIIALTAEAVRAIAVYAPPSLRTETGDQIARARTWLLRARARTTDDQAMLLLGLSSSHASDADVRKAARSLIYQQRADGGWGGNPNLPSDAFSTGEALYALRESHTAAVRDRVYQRAIDFLLRTQDASGAWHVRSRAVKVMPYFSSDFPFGDDQWISAAGTALADVALSAILTVR